VRGSEGVDTISGTIVSSRCTLYCITSVTSRWCGVPRLNVSLYFSPLSLPIFLPFPFPPYVFPFSRCSFLLGGFPLELFSLLVHFDL
jgi:hypothetical protein